MTLPALTPYDKPWRKTDDPEWLKRRNSRDRRKSEYPGVARTLTAKRRQFAGIDGEGWGDDKHGRQPYRMILTASEDRILGALTSPEHLSWWSVLHWMVALPREYTYVGYGFGYDVTQILRTLPEQTIHSLMNPETRDRVNQHGKPYRALAYTPKVEIDGAYWYFGLEYIPRKQLKVRACRSPDLDHWNHQDGTWIKLKTFTVWDVLSFFQTRFLNAATDSKLFDRDTLELIGAGKLRRGDGADHDMNTEIAYCAAECKALAAMMANVNTLCCDAGYPLRDFYGAGSVATAMMRVENTKEHTHPVTLPPEVLDACSYAFFGGRFETRLFGYVGDLWEYDINSAYPFVQSTVPCMVHGRWVHWAKEWRREQIGIAYARWNWFTPVRGGTPIRPTWAPFLQRSEHNGVHSPPSGEGWFCLNEVDAALHWALISGYQLDVTEAWIWEPSCDVHPFAYMADGYETRKQLKAAEDGRQMVYKLGLNSHSGKCDQTVGAAPWHHPFLACWIKAGCRAMLIDAIAQNPEAVAGVATDAVYSLQPLDLPIGDKLGQWSCEHKTDAFMFQPGIGWGAGEDQWVKRRGIARLTPELRASVVEQFARFGELTTITVEQPIFYGLARNRERFKLGRWSVQPREVRIGPGDKRFVLTDRRWKDEAEQLAMHEALTGRPLTDHERWELPPLTPYVPQRCYDSLPRDGIIGRCGYAYDKFAAFWSRPVTTACDGPGDADERQLLDDEADAVSEREWLVSDD